MPKLANIFICFNLSTRINTKLSHFYFHSKPIITTPVPTHQQIAHLILDQKSATQALETFRWASKLPNFTHSQSTYKAVINKLCVFREFEVVKELLDEMPSSIGSPPDEDIFITLVRGLGRAHRIKEVIKVLELVSKFEKRPSLKVYNSILDVLVKEDIDIAREFYRKKMMGSGVQGDGYTYGILMKGLCLTNRIADGFKLLQMMKTRGLRPNTVVYNTLLHALCKNGKTGRARSLMNDIKEPNDVTFNILISAYCHDNNLVQALVILEKSLSNGFVPDKIAVTKLLDSLCNEGRVSDAVQILERVEEKGGTFDVVAYNTLLKGFCRLGKVKVGSRFIKEMERKGCLPNADTYNSLITGYCESGMFDSALDIFNEMKTVGVKWNFDTFNTLIRGLSLGGKVEDSLKILELMEENKVGSYPNISPYNSIIYGMYRENRLNEALEFLSTMEILFPKAVDRTQRILRHCEASNIDEAKDIYAQMTDSGGIPSPVVYTSMIDAFCQKERVKEALDLMVDMIDRGYIPIAKTVNTLITGLCRQNKVRTALKLMEDMAGKRGFSPDSGTYNPVIVSLCNKGDLQTAVLLFMQMLEKGITPEYESWNALVVCLCQQTAWLEGNGEFYLNRQFLRILGT